MRALDRKLWRDLARLKGQAAAIALVIASGVMTLVISVATHDALRGTQARFYQDYQFAEVFADLKRAPEGLAGRLRELPGVNLLETRVRAPVRIEVPGFGDPIRGVLLSLPDGRQPVLNRLHLREGGLPESGRADQVVVSDAFAEAHGLRAGDALTLIVDGRLVRASISGVAVSPEFVYQISPSDLLPDYRRYGILWMNRRALARAYGMDGAFNNVVATLQAGAAEAPVIAALEQVLAPYGVVFAHGRGDQHSHRFLDEELRQLRAQALLLPTLFLLVSAFLLNVVMGRIIRTQREQVAVLKAFGYTNREIAAHYGVLTAAIVLVGWLAGMVLGVWAASGLTRLYAEYFRFPHLRLQPQPWVMLLALAVAGGAAALGTARSVWKAVSMPPAQAMRPAPPARFRPGWLERTALGRLLDQPTRIIVRNLARQPLKAALSVTGIGLSSALLMMGTYQLDAVQHMIDTQYRLVHRMDLHLGFTDATSPAVAGALRSLPGVLAVETYRSVPVRLRVGHRDYATAILGLERTPQLRQLLDVAHRPQTLPPDGLLLTEYLARDLGLEVGDSVEVEILEGRRRVVSLPLAGVVDEPIGVSAYMARAALNRVMREGPAVSGAWLLIERERGDIAAAAVGSSRTGAASPSASPTSSLTASPSTSSSTSPSTLPPSPEADLMARLWRMPGVASIGMISDAERGIRDYMADTIQMFATVFVLLAASIAFAVVYNNARITFAERARDLATLEVLGYSRLEVSWILLGEIAVLTLLALPVGALVGIGFCWAINQAFNMDLFRIPLVITPRAYGVAAAGVLVASLLAGLLVARRLGTLDKVAVLKAVE